MARFLVDEDLPRSLAPFLTAAGLFAEGVRDRGLRGRPDEDVFRDAVGHGFAVLSGDLGFGNLLRFPLGTHHGIVVAHFPNDWPVGAVNQAILAGRAGSPTMRSAGAWWSSSLVESGSVDKHERTKFAHTWRP